MSQHNIEIPWRRIHEELGVSAPAFDDRSLASYVAQYASEIPDNPALCYFERDISYTQLHEWSNRPANNPREKP